MKPSDRRRDGPRFVKQLRWNAWVTSRTLGGGSHSAIAPFIVIGKLTDKGDPNFGYDTQSGEYKDTVTAGIIDPTKVVRVALQDDASIAGLLIPTEGMVADRRETQGPTGYAAGRWNGWHG